MRAKHHCVPFAGSILILVLSACSADVSRLSISDQDDEVSQADMMDRVVTSIGPPDSNGLLGRNREWGRFHSVRFQYGAGRALRHGFATQNNEIVTEARRAIEAGLSTIEATGAFPASVPGHIAKGRKPSISDQASAAAFFLSDVCPALLIAGSEPADQERVARAISWLTDHQSILLERDKAAPNRLLINALAFAGCGRLVEDAEIRKRATPFIAAALRLTEDDGSFIEADGSDTSYQAVSLVAAVDLASLLDNAEQVAKLDKAIAAGARWLADRIDENGALDSSNNSRTCADEEFLGRKKIVDLREVYRALAYADELELVAPEKLEAYTAWLAQSPDPCASSD